MRQNYIYQTRSKRIFRRFHLIHLAQRAFVSAILLLCSMTTHANPIDSEEATFIAKQFLGKEVQPLNLPKKMVGTSLVAPAIHIFNASDDHGFVIVSGDDRLMPVLAYSDNGKFDPDKAPESALWMIAQYQNAIEKIKLSKQDTKRKLPQKNPIKKISIAPLISTHWDQAEPYNNECPSLGGTKALTGCVATAMAQVINYENKSSVVAPIPAYFYESGYLEGLPQREFNFGNLNEEDIAYLMRYCGQSVEMNYGITESGAASEKVPDALLNYFGWEDDVKLLRRADYNDQHWNRMVTEEIAAGHPIIYSAMNESGVGHEFVVDGIEDEYFHVNWGWSGTADGYYSFSPFGSDDKALYILWQDMVTTRDDDPSNDVIDYGTTINGINYQLSDDLTAAVLPLKNGEKYKGELVIPSTVEYNGNTYTVTFLGQGAFVNCKHLTSISIPASITGQAWSIFDGCENLHKVNVEDLYSFIKLEVGGWWTGSPLTYGADLYLNGQIVKDLVIPEGIETVGYCKFANCTSVETITFPSTMKVAGQYSFSGCPKLKYVDMLGSSLELIDIVAFVNDEALDEVRLPATLKTIRGDAFSQINGPGCKKLRKITSLATLPPNIEGEISAFCGIAFSFNILSDACLYVPDSSIELYKNAKEWKRFCEILPLSEEKPLPVVDTISAGHFRYEINITEKFAKVLSRNWDYTRSFDDSDLNHTIIPANVEYKNETYPVEEIGYRALYGETFENLEIKAPIRKIGIETFNWAKVNTELKLPDSLKSIPECAFRNFSTSKLYLPSSLEYLGENALCAEEDINYYETFGDGICEIEIRNELPPVVCESTFDNHQFEHTILKVPYGSKKTYSIVSGWSNFKNIENIGDEQEIINHHDLAMVASLKGKTSLRNGMPLHVNGTVYNRGSQALNGFKLKWDIDNCDSDEKSFEIELGPNDSFVFDLYIKFNISNNGQHVLSISSELSDGTQDDDSSDNDVELNFETFDNNYYRVSLIEQFTSEHCSLTPSVNPKVYNAIEKTGNSDFTVQVFNHCGFYDDFLTMNHDYEWFYNDWGTYTPAMMLNRTDILNTGCTPVMSIEDRVEFDLQNESGLCNAMVSVSCDIHDNKVCVNAVLDKNKDFDLTAGYDYVTVFLIEDSIPAREQIDAWSDEYLENYYHRNVLRKILTSQWGERIMWDGDSCLYKFETEINPEWNKDNLSAVAFIHRYDPQSPIDCQVYTAGASYLPQYRDFPDDSANWTIWNSGGVENIELNISKLYMSVDEECELVATITPENAIGRLLTWTSSDDNIVSIQSVSDDSSHISIRTKSPGTTTITATASNGKSASCSVIIEKLTIYPPENVVCVGDEIYIPTYLEPWDADPSENKLTWEISDDSVAAIKYISDDTSFINLIALKEGITTITATTPNGISASCVINVDVREVETITLSEYDIKMYVDGQYHISADVYPWDASYKSLTWKSSDENVVDITYINDDTSSIDFRALKQGTAIITATAENGIIASCNVTVNTIEVSSIWFDISEMEIYKGDQRGLYVYLEPWDTTDRSLTWTSSDTAVVTVTPDSENPQNAVLNALKAGNATITAIASNGLTATCNVVVRQDVESISIDKSEMRLTLGGDPAFAYGKLTAAVLPEDASDKTINWYSQNDGIATVDQEGNVTAQHAGEVDIIAQTNMGHQAICHVIVTQLATGIVIEGMPEGEVQVGDKFRLSAVVYPEEATDTSVNWSSDNEHVASVDADGNVEILSEGSTVIRATANDGSECEALCYIDAVVGVEMLIDAGKPFRVYDIQGHLLMKEAAPKDLDMLAKGIYILVQGSNTCKFIR